MPTITAPEGYARQDAALTVEQLLGATIYDANGDAVGEVQDLVFDAATGAAAGAATGTEPVGRVDATEAMSTKGTSTDGATMGTANTETDTTGAATDIAAITDEYAQLAPLKAFGAIFQDAEGVRGGQVLARRHRRWRRITLRDISVVSSRSRFLVKTVGT